MTSCSAFQPNYNIRILSLDIQTPAEVQPNLGVRYSPGCLGFFKNPLPKTNGWHLKIDSFLKRRFLLENTSFLGSHLLVFRRVAIDILITALPKNLTTCKLAVSFREVFDILITWQPLGPTRD